MNDSCPTRRMALEIIEEHDIDGLDYSGSPLDFEFTEKLINAVETYVMFANPSELHHAVVDAGSYNLQAAEAGAHQQRASISPFVAALLVAVWDALETEGLIEHSCPSVATS